MIYSTLKTACFYKRSKIPEIEFESISLSGISKEATEKFMRLLCIALISKFSLFWSYLIFIEMFNKSTTVFVIKVTIWKWIVSQIVIKVTIWKCVSDITLTVGGVCRIERDSPMHSTIWVLCLFIVSYHFTTLLLSKLISYHHATWRCSYHFT